VGLSLVVLALAVRPAWGLDVAVPYVRADFMWAQGYTGSGVEVGVIDAYLGDGTHSSISANYLGSEKFALGPTLQGDHATQVAGVAVGQDGTYTGAAPEAGWWIAQTVNHKFVTAVRDQTIAAETFGQGLASLAGDGVEVITLSIGVAGSSDGTNSWSLALDHIVNTNGPTITVAAGNDGPGAGSITGWPTAAYNVITVGATGDTGGASSEDYTRLAGYSSRGPTADGRSLPDIVAPGSNIYMPHRGGWGEASGTSFATPIVAGGAALLIDMGRTLGYPTEGKVIKSVLLNSVEKLSGFSHTPTQPLDYGQGAGQMNLQRAHGQYAAGEQAPGAVAGVGWDRGVVSGSAENVYLFDLPAAAGERLTATLVWDRIVNTDTEDIKDLEYSLGHLANLDLFLYHADDLTTPIASSVSTLDNVEHLYVSVPAVGRYALGVKKMAGGAGDEAYALAWDLLTARIVGDADDNGFVDPEDLAVLLANWESGPAIASTWATGDFTGDTDVNDADLSLLLANWTGPPPPAGTMIPEPVTAASLALGVLALRRRRRPADPCR